uniref:Helicase ATP-binding domain-containing protein n=1 Tax=Caenorhabditis japonica TaxID=281687 RepID=A0A8R1I9P5_CAEJA
MVQERSAEELDDVVHLPGENTLERFEALLERTNNFAIPITQADIRAVHGNNGKRMASKLMKTAALNMVAQGYDRTATYYDMTPKFINGEMRDYQIEGLNWMISLQKAGLNGVLADEMGLGKTLQAISLLAHNKIVEKTSNPSLVIVPLPTILNWGDEVTRFCPKMRVIVLKGTMEERREMFGEAEKARSYDVCIASYETAINLVHNFQKVHFNYIVIDEAQRIKNANVSLAVAVRSLRSDRRLLLTGTPFQNNIYELWSLLHYLVPALFDDADEFTEYFSSQNLSEDVNLVNRLHRILNPFMLRRVKHDVEKSLLPKKEYKMYMGLTELQKKWYAKVLSKEIEIIKEGRRSQKLISHILMALREVANHPYMLPAAEPEGPPFVTDERIVTSSGKMMVLDKLLDRFKVEGSRVLLFSQFTMMLDILEDYAIWKE